MDREQIGGMIIDAVHEVFETLVYTFPEEGPPAEISPSPIECELLSTVDLSGGFRGAIAMLCSMKAGEALARNMLGVPEEELGAGAVADSAGEIVNMVSGRVKSRLVNSGYDLTLSIPTVDFPGKLVPPSQGSYKGTKVDFTVDGESISFILMVEDSVADRSASAEAPAEKLGGIPNMNRLLIIDDSSTMRKIISRALRQSGFPIGEIVEAENGEAGLDMMRSSRVNLVLTDINRPVMNGLKFIEAVRSNPLWEKTPIIVITTEGSEGMAKESIKRGANNIVRKPFTPEQIREKLTPYFA